MAFDIDATAPRFITNLRSSPSRVISTDFRAYFAKLTALLSSDSHDIRIAVVQTLIDFFALARRT
jgi:hypothetical protein